MSAYPVKVYGWDAVKLADAYDLSTLNELREVVQNDPANANPEHAAGRSIYLYTPAARRKLDALTWAVFHRCKTLAAALPEDAA